MSNSFTPQARRVWDRIPMRARTLILNRVWCEACASATTIIHFHGVVRRGELMIRGRCQRCGHAVSRVFEQE